LHLGLFSSLFAKHSMRHERGLVLSVYRINYRRRSKLVQNPHIGVGTLNGVKVIPTFLRRSIPRVRVRLKRVFGPGVLLNITSAVLFLVGLVSIGSLIPNIEFRSGEGVGRKVEDIKPGQGAVINKRDVSRRCGNHWFSAL